MLGRDIVDYAAGLFDLTVDDLREDRRTAHIVRARFALYLGLYWRAERRGVHPILTDIGRCVHRDRTTVLHGLRRANALLADDPALREAAEKIANLNAGIFAEYACNRKLQVVEEVHQQPEDEPMDDPNYIEERVNTALAAAGRADVAIYWNGDIVTQEDPAFFDVTVGDDETPFYVTDCGSYFAIQTQTRPGYVETHAEARTFDEVAAELLAVLATEEA